MEITLVSGNERSGRSSTPALLLFTLFAVLSQSVQGQTATATPDSLQDPLNISIDGILKFLNNAGNNKAAEAMAIKLIEIHGLSSRPTEGELAKLRSAFPSSALIEAIEHARVPPPLPAPVIPKTGELVVLCQPVDCEVRVNGNPVGSSNRGILSRIVLPEGSAKVSAVRQSYEPDYTEHETAIRSGGTARVTFVFKPTRAALSAAGSKLFQQMLEALGQTGGPDSDVLRCAGTIYLHSGSGQVTAWPVVSWLRDPDIARFDFGSLGEKYQSILTEAGFIWRTSRKTKPQALPEAMQLALEGQLLRLVGRLKDPGFQTVAVDLRMDNQSAYVFRAEKGRETYVITLDPAYRPAEIRVEAADGVTSGWRMLYADYVKNGNIFSPKTTQVILPRGEGGIEARFATVTSDPSYHVDLKSPFK